MWPKDEVDILGPKDDQDVISSLAGQTFAARGGEGGTREGGKRTSGHYRQVSVAWRNSKT